MFAHPQHPFPSLPSTTSDASSCSETPGDTTFNLHHCALPHVPTGVPHPTRVPVLRIDDLELMHTGRFMYESTTTVDYGNRVLDISARHSTSGQQRAGTEARLAVPDAISP